MTSAETGAAAPVTAPHKGAVRPSRTARLRGPASSARRRLRFSRLVAAFFVGAMVLSAGCSSDAGDSAGDDSREQRKVDVPLAEAADRIKVTVPAGAVEVTWAYIAGFQDDIVMLSFRMPEAELEAYLRANHVDLPLEPGTQRTSWADFPRYGAGPAPEAVADGRHGSRPADGHGYIPVTVSVGPPENGLVRVWIHGFH